MARKRDKTVWIEAKTHKILSKMAKKHHLSISSLADIMLSEVLEMFEDFDEKQKEGKMNEKKKERDNADDR